MHTGATAGDYPTCPSAFPSNAIWAMAVIKSNSTVADATQWAGSKGTWTQGLVIGREGACVDKKWSTWMWQRQKPGVLFMILQRSQKI